MAFSLAPTIGAVDRVAPAGIPLGKSVLFGVGLGLSTAVINALKVAGLESYLTGPGLAYLIKRVAPVRGFLGDTLTEVVAIAAGTAALDDQLNKVWPGGITGGVRKAIADGAGALGLADDVKKAEIQYGSADDVQAMIDDLNEALTALKGAVAGTPSAQWLGELQPVAPAPNVSAIPQRASRSNLEGMPAGEEYEEVENIVSQIAF